jgi:hypothetical protein
MTTFKISDEYLQGFEVILDLDYYENMEEICAQVQKKVTTHLKLYKFERLLERIKHKKFHIHDETMGSVLLKGVNNITWVCSHCNGS